MKSCQHPHRGETQKRHTRRRSGWRLICLHGKESQNPSFINGFAVNASNVPFQKPKKDDIYPACRSRKMTTKGDHRKLQRIMKRRRRTKWRGRKRPALLILLHPYPPTCKFFLTNLTPSFDRHVSTLNYFLSASVVEEIGVFPRICWTYF